MVEVGNRPEGVTVDSGSGLVFVATREPDRLVALDRRTGKIANRVEIPGPARHLQLAAPGGPVIVPAEPADQVALLPLDGRPLKTVRVGTQPHDATGAGGQIFVGDERSDSVTVLDTEGNRLDGFKVARQPGGLAPAGEDGSHVAVVSVRDRVLELYEAAPPYKRVARADAGVGPTHVVSDGKDRLFVTDTAGNALLTFEIEPELRLTRRIALESSPYGIAIDTERERLWVTLTGTNRVVKLWTDGPRTVANVASVRQPDTIAVDEASGRAFVTGKVDGVVQVLDPADRRPRARTP